MKPFTHLSYCSEDYQQIQATFTDVHFSKCFIYKVIYTKLLSYFWVTFLYSKTNLDNFSDSPSSKGPVYSGTRGPRCGASEPSGVFRNGGALCWRGWWHGMERNRQVLESLYPSYIHCSWKFISIIYPLFLQSSTFHKFLGWYLIF